MGLFPINPLADYIYGLEQDTVDKLTQQVLDLCDEPEDLFTPLFFCFFGCRG